MIDEFWFNRINISDKTNTSNTNNKETAVELNKKGWALHTLGRYNEAIQFYDRALKINPNYADTWNYKGISFYNLKKYDEAIQAYDRAIRINPNYAYAWNNKGCVFHTLGRYNEAIQFYDRALKINPNFADALNNRSKANNELVRSKSYRIGVVTSTFKEPGLTQAKVQNQIIDMETSNTTGSTSRGFTPPKVDPPKRDDPTAHLASSYNNIRQTIWNRR
jgi:tetratricopeptide (TPR) repeat protein